MNFFIKIYAISVLILLLLIGCKKDPVFIPPKDLTGQWEWIYTYKIYLLSDSNPLTPQNTGNHEMLVFNPNQSWYKTINDIKIDSGTFSLGHGSYTAYQGAELYIYDSISYYQNGFHIIGGEDYYKIFNDTLEFTPGFSGKFFSYSLPNNGSKFWIKR